MKHCKGQLRTHTVHPKAPQEHKNTENTHNTMQTHENHMQQRVTTCKNTSQSNFQRVPRQVVACSSRKGGMSKAVPPILGSAQKW